MFIIAKRSMGYNFKGDFDAVNFHITETTKDSINVYDIMKVLQEFDGQPVTFSIKLDTDVEPLNE